jgi:tetratricopeptide (TPR) repeat protein
MKPDYGLAYLGLGDVYFYQTKQYAPALDAYRQGVRYRDDNPTAFYNLAWCANELNRYAEAATAAKQALALKADYPEAHVELGYASRKLGEAAPETSPQAPRLFDEAITHYREEIRLKPGYGLAYTGLGDVYFVDLKQYPQAALAYQQSITIAPNNARVRYNLGWTYNDLTRYAEAADQLREAVRLKPEYVEAHSELGFANLKLHRLPMAMDSLRTAIRLKPEYALAHYYLGLVFIEQHNKVGAQEQYKILQRLDPKKAQQLFDAAPANMRY